jgi:lipase chaperone LimK
VLGVALVAAVRHVREPDVRHAFESAPPRPATDPDARDVGRVRSLPAALRGTSPDGALETDGRGHLVVSLDLREFFDYFLIATGEESRARLRARIVAALRARLRDPAADEARAILDRYLAYRTRIRRGVSDLQTLHALRRRILGAEVADAFFATEEDAQAAALERLSVAGDPRLTPVERRQRLSALEGDLPAAVRAGRADAVGPLELLREEDALRAGGASTADIQELREHAVGREAAARLAVLDQQCAAWQARLDEYRAARAMVEHDPGLDPAARARAIDALRGARFTPTEQLRVAALDRAAGLDR